MPIIDEETELNVFERVAEYQPAPSWRTWLFGRPLQSADAPHQTIGKTVGLAVFASDALSSTAYATDEILFVLAAVGIAAFAYALPISLAIVALLTILTLSYEQTIHAYPGGGGAYIVARDNLGELPAQTAGAALLTDYILTVSVSVASGVAQLTSAYPFLIPYRVVLSVGFILFIMLINLRGVRESGVTFSIPTYFFLAMMFSTVGIGFYRYMTGSLDAVVNPPSLRAPEMASVSLFLILHAFSNGTTAVTGVEAISNGITAFKEPRSRNAGMTLIWMSAVLGTLFLGITFLAVKVGALPSEQETVISQLARTVFQGQGLLYLATIAGTTLILVMAANTAFADFPRLSALQAGDGFLPRQLTYRGSRLVFSRGIVALALIASLLIVLFQASVTALIPLYAIGVFLSFTLSQAGMARRWWKVGRLAPGQEVQERGSTLRYDPRWALKMGINGFGSFCTAVVMLVFTITKFRDGAWIVALLVPAMVVVFWAIHHHYRDLAAHLSLEDFGPPQRMSRHRVIMPISGVHRGTVAALRYARSLSDDITAVYVSMDPAEAERVRSKWEWWGEGVRLMVLHSPYRLFLEPLVGYIEEIAAQRQPNETITIVVPQFVPRRRWHNLMHTQAAMWLRMALLFKRGVVVTNVPYQLE
ncbi:MAG: APC family permease [Candidatus Methylomirabilis oxygeniifera]|uniref:Amino acid permease-associated region n=1 Tax=Methylomirabilis oxygeniifera TaxID=671143 RepID=D5MJC4_METO1|nr:MAG: APC family permease [Candidatus Methylomirabilis oxyfera]CBE67489.1 Amino acid permease-associated region [Candidatus Methylomirabilis oxyfera]